MKLIIKILDAFLLLISPLAILMFVVGTIMALDGYSTHRDFLRRLAQNGATAQAIVERADETWVFVRFADPQGDPARVGLVRRSYYPAQVLAALQPGARLEIRYLLPIFESQAVITDRMADVEGYWGFLWQPGILLLASWVVIILHPEPLFWGFVDLPAAFEKAGSQR